MWISNSRIEELERKCDAMVTENIRLAGKIADLEFRFREPVLCRDDFQYTWYGSAKDALIPVTAVVRAILDHLGLSLTARSATPRVVELKKQEAAPKKK